jgi:uncharacterized protein (TIRG00374 family)
MVSRSLTVKNKKQWLFLIASLLVIYAVVPQFGSFKSSLHYVLHSDVRYLLFAAGFSLLSYFSAALTYYLLALKPLLYRVTVVIQFASMFANRLLPAGIGSNGVNYLYLKKCKHTTTQAAAVVAVNNLLGFIGHLLVLAVAITVSGMSLNWHLHRNFGYLLIAAVFVTIVLAISSNKKLRKNFSIQLRQLLISLSSYRHQLPRVGLALLSSVSLTLCNVLCLWFAGKAVGLDVNFVQTLLAFTLGIAIGAAAPTPGGIGGIEGGIVAGLVGFSVTSALALAAVLLYRLFNFWIGFALGGIAFIYATKRNYI